MLLVFSCPKKEERKLLLPQKNSDERKVTSYLLGRCIDREIIDYCVKKGYIYESLPYHNVIFVGYDSENIPRYAIVPVYRKNKISWRCGGK